ncbi:MAG TPA: hypothetical protein VGO19_07505 [Actinomycetes bacterium]
MDTRWRVRQVVNLVNLSTPVGVLLGLAGRARFDRGPDGVVLARGWRLPAHASAVTIGNVVLLRLDDAALAARPTLLRHEARHASQYAWCLGLPMLPLYVLAAAWSWLRCRDYSSYNVFEVRAGLADGGYIDRRRRSEERA